MISIFSRYPESIIVVNQEGDFGPELLCQRYGICLRKNQVVNVSNIYDWREIVCGFDAGIGTRIHGLMALVSCAKPVFMYKVDHRVSELADRMLIPGKTILELSENEDIMNVFGSIEFDADLFDQNRAWIANSYITALEALGISVSSYVHRIRETVRLQVQTSRRRRRTHG